ncbi:MAG: hypothetical protein AAGC92_14245 [Pseudomonadota bacterium]
MTFLDLCQRVASESGTVAGSGLPSSVSGQTGRLGRIVVWVQEALRDIENSRSDWKWMTAEFFGTAAQGQAELTPASLGIADHAWWLVQDEATALYPWTIYTDTTNFDDETRLFWNNTSHIHLYGGQRTQTGKPVRMFLTPEDNVRLYPIPDADYVVRGWYRRSPQDLQENDTTPNLPSRFHDLIWLMALDRLMAFDEAFEQIGIVRERIDTIRRHLQRDYLPRFSMGAPLA